MLVDVLVIGAGAAGLTAAWDLKIKGGLNVQILEATSRHGGRLRKLNGFSDDFPIALGGEWIHTDPSILAKLNNNPQSNTEIELITYNPQTISVWRNGKLRKRNVGRNFYSEYKFKNSTWFDFFDELMVPAFREKIIYNSPVTLETILNDMCLTISCTYRKNSRGYVIDAAPASTDATI